MCLTFFYIPNSATQKFIMSFNRDETKTKKTNPLAPFSDDQNIIAGRDLEGLGKINNYFLK